MRHAMHSFARAFVVLGLVCATVTATGAEVLEENRLTLAVLYDNDAFEKGMKADWGLSYLVEGSEKTVLFDTGKSEKVFLHNVRELGKDLGEIDALVLSHNHGDHTGNVFTVLDRAPGAGVYVPVSFPRSLVKRLERAGAQVSRVSGPVEICEGVHLTGELGSPGQVREQALVLSTAQGLVVLTGCSHPGIVRFVRKAEEALGREVRGVLGGFHLIGASREEVKETIAELQSLGVSKAGPSHCTGDAAIQLFREAFGDGFIRVGAGTVLRF